LKSGAADACAGQTGEAGRHERTRRAAGAGAGVDGACADKKKKRGETSAHALSRSGRGVVLRMRCGVGAVPRMRSAMRRAAHIMAAAVSPGSGAEAGPKRPRPDTPPRIGTHDGTFHCDEVLACYLLRLLPRYRVRPRGTGTAACSGHLAAGPAPSRDPCSATGTPCSAPAPAPARPRVPGPSSRPRFGVPRDLGVPLRVPGRTWGPWSHPGATLRFPVPPGGFPVPPSVHPWFPSPSWRSPVPPRGHL